MGVPETELANEPEQEAEEVPLPLAVTTAEQTVGPPEPLVKVRDPVGTAPDAEDEAGVMVELNVTA
jgi:hypothetical protein